ncbi:unnamed protein product [Rotaria sp. Silwood1]|nr:unnamed protein product [Rotaria sp. Silwood1]
MLSESDINESLSHTLSLYTDASVERISSLLSSLIFKTSKGHFYYTELTNADESATSTSTSSSLSGIGPRVKLTFGKYDFFRGNIYYKPVGITSKSKEQIKKYVDEHRSQNTIYDLWSNNCQHYVKSVIKDFLKLEYPSGSVQMASKPENLTLGPSESSSSSSESSSSSPEIARGGRWLSTPRFDPSRILRNDGCFGTPQFDPSRILRNDGCFGRPHFG